VAFGGRIAATGAVTLCYRRPRQLPDWRYNLFCMIHGKDRDDVSMRVAALSATCGLDACPHAVLFSRRRFKQRGARYAPSSAPVDSAPRDSAPRDSAQPIAAPTMCFSARRF